MKAVVSSQFFISAARSSSWSSQRWVLPMSLSQTSPMWVLPIGCSSSQTAPAWVLFIGPFLFHHRSPAGSLILPENLSSCQEPAGPWGLHRPQLLRGISTCSNVVSSINYRVDNCSTMVLHGLQGDKLCHCGLQGNLCSSTWSTSFPPSPLTLVFAELWLAYFHSSLPAAVPQRFYPCLGMLSQRCYQLCWLVAMAPSWSQVELTLSNVEASSGVISQKPLLQALCY